MRAHWQRSPLLVRSAFPDFRAPLTPDQLFELAGQDDVESRLVTSARGRWTLRHGPFDPDELPPANKRDWTLLVQGVDLHLDDVHALLSRFRFVADARLDDLMVSYATDRGGVGAHVDSYDVFLLQAHGRRRWRIGPPGAHELLDGLPLKVLARFEPSQEHVLEPGDMLYLPPGWAHEGTAIGECMTFSIGFRAPSRHELLAAWFADCADAPAQGPDPRYGDRGSKPTRLPARLPETMHATLAGWLRDWRPSPRAIDRFLGRFLTEPKPQVWFPAPARRSRVETFAARAARAGVRVDRRTRLAYRRRDFFINGEHCPLAGASAALLRRLADERILPPEALGATSVDPGLIARLHEWFDAGWIHFGPP